MFAAFNNLIERRIDEARRQGAFDDLPGSGRPPEVDALRDAGEGRGTRRMIALAIALERRGAQLTTGAALEFRRAFVAKVARGRAAIGAAGASG